ncbi:cation:proton antiporter domain-containing protein [Paludifilum halophilum]|uniref:RCK C-terminal domain-containing protein n=1 Tax=Paludifilum halophilum TaxID=1642702 RepID=A0A235B992_9BACL|nr:cation:proton antiporter [Paludifilum halophilum]OYD08165.1 hypothetical protein CHM34_08650 [Paludifilum halophilum]
MEGHSVVSLMIVVIAAFLIPIVLHRLRWRAIPVVVAEIAVGLVLGESGLQLIQQDELLDLLSMLGIIYLMFLTGLEIDFDLIRRSRNGSQKVNPLWISLVGFTGIFALSFLFAWVLNVFGIVNEVFFMTLIISTISVSVTLPVLKDKGLLNVPLGQTILLTAVIADLVTMILLAVFVSFRQSSEGVTDILLLLLLFVGVFVVYRLIHWFQPLKIMEKIHQETVSIGTRGVFALILFFVAFSERVGAENILGAFLAGVILSLLSPKKEFVQQLNAFGFGFLIPVFFVMVGAELDLPGMFQDPQALSLLPLLLIAFYLSKMVLIPIFRRFFGRKESIGSSLLLGSTLSLVIAAAKVGMDMGIINNTTNTALVLAAVVTVLTSPVVFQRLVEDAHGEEKVYRAALIGFNPVTMKLAKDLSRDGYHVTMYGSDQTNLEPLERHPFRVVEVAPGDLDQLDREGMFDREIVVAFTRDDEWNLEMALEAEKRGVEQVIARAEAKQRLPEETRIQFVSAFFSNTTLVKAMIEYPTLLRLVTTHEHLHEISVNNEQYHCTRIQDLARLGDPLVLRIIRGKEVIVPHGETVLHVGDRLIVGDTPPEEIWELRRILE